MGLGERVEKKLLKMMRRVLYSNMGLFKARRLGTYSGSSAWVKNFINEAQQLAGPKEVLMCDGSEEEANQLIDVSGQERARKEKRKKKKKTRSLKLTFLDHVENR